MDLPYIGMLIILIFCIIIEELQLGNINTWSQIQGLQEGAVFSKGFNHTLCHQSDGELVRAVALGVPVAGQHRPHGPLLSRAEPAASRG